MLGCWSAGVLDYLLEHGILALRDAYWELAIQTFTRSTSCVSARAFSLPHPSAFCLPPSLQIASLQHRCALSGVSSASSKVEWIEGKRRSIQHQRCAGWQDKSAGKKRSGMRAVRGVGCVGCGDTRDTRAAGMVCPADCCARELRASYGHCETRKQPSCWPHTHAIVRRGPCVVITQWPDHARAATTRPDHGAQSQSSRHTTLRDVTR